MSVVRLAAIGALGSLVWVVGASRVHDHERLPLDSIVVGAAVTQLYGCTALALEPVEPMCPTGHFHSGLDLAAPEGTAVHAAASGTARAGFDSGGAGLYVVVSGDQGVHILYCHLSAIDVRDGARVSAGDVIGEVGATGLATGAHLHLEVQVAGRAIDPITWLAS